MAPLKLEIEISAFRGSLVDMIYSYDVLAPCPTPASLRVEGRNIGRPRVHLLVSTPRF
jgi:hypothetical protein